MLRMMMVEKEMERWDNSMGKPSGTGRKEMPCGQAQGAVADMTISGDKEDAPWHLDMSESILKAHEEQT